jgi:ACS family D-galactonate transporter-like MFS transporter
MGILIERQRRPALQAILSMLVLSVCLNYMARSAFGIAGPVMSKELGLRPDQFGLLLAAFFWLYPTVQPLTGWLVDRYNVAWVLGIGSLLWSLMAGITGLAGSFATLLILRLALGVTESVAYPSYGKIIATHFPESRRGLCNALIEVGNQVGPALAMLMGGVVVEQFGWRTFFFAIGLISFLWIPAWARLAPRRQAVAEVKTAVQEGPGPGFKEILRLRSAWGTFFGLFAINYGWIFLVTWLPSYLVMERQFSVRMMGILGSIPFWGLAASTLLSGWLSDRWIRKGGAPTRVRKTFAVSGLLLCLLFLPAVLVRDQVISMVLLCIATLSFGMPSSNVFAITQTMAGPRMTGKWTGMQNGFGNLAGVVAPWLTGVVVARTGAFYLAFVAVCLVALAGAASFLFLVGRVEPVAWKKPAEAAARTE